MQLKTSLSCAAYACAFLLAQPAAASGWFLLDQSTVGRSDNVAWLSLGAAYVNHKDSNIGGVGLATSEHGVIPTIQIGGSMLADMGFFMSGSASFAMGDTDYTGFDATYSPVNGKTENSMVTVEAQAGWNVSPFDTVAVIPYLEGSYQFWNRKTSGNLKYNHYAALGGVKLQYAATEQMVVSAYGAYGTIFESTMDATSASLSPANKPIIKVGAKLSYTMPNVDRYELFLTSDYTSLKYGESSDYVLSSFTHQLVTRAGFAYRFR